MEATRLQTFGFVRAIDEPNRRVTSVVSTDAVARDGAIIEAAGWDLGHYQKNPVVLWAHDDTQPPIARALETSRTDHELIQVHEFDEEGNDPVADRVFKKIARGLINATSVRWLPGETELRSAGRGKDPILVFKNGHQLLEASYVPIPSDPGAVVLRADGKPFDARAFVRHDGEHGEGEEEPKAEPCVAADCQNPRDEGEYLCAECQALLTDAREGGDRAANEARDARAADLARRLRAASQALKGAAA